MSRFTEHLPAYRAHMALVAQFLSPCNGKQTALAERSTKPHASAVSVHNAPGAVAS